MSTLILSIFVGSGALGLASAAEVPAVSAPLSANPVVRWATHLPGEVPNVAAPTEPGAPVVSGKHIFVGYSGVNALLVLDRGDGRVVARLATRAPVSCAPIVADDRLIVADSAGYTAGWTKKDGEWTQRWEHYSGAPIVSTPTVLNGTVYVTNVDELVFALDATTGELRWRYQHRLDAARSTELELFGAPAATVGGDFVYAGFSDGFLAALDRATGTEQWTALVGEGTYPDLIAPAVPLEDGSVLVAGYSRPLEHLDTTTRSPSWRIDVGSAAAPAIDGETMFHPGSDGKLRRVNTRTGSVAWTWDSTTTGPLLTPEVTPLGVLVASTDSTVFLIDPETGTVRWTLEPGPRLTGFSSPPTVAGDDIYALSNGGVVYALRGRAAAPVPEPPPWVAPK